MINKKFIQKLKKEHDGSNSERRQIISLSNVVLHDSKRIIFALHRGDQQKAEESFVEVEKVIAKLEKKFGWNRLYQEGSFKAGIEEFVEAKMFYFLINGQKIDKIKNVKFSYESYLGGICDATGEMIRKATNEVAKGNIEEVKKIKELLNDIMAELVEFDMSGYLRTKYDQARGNLRKIEQINYEVEIRK